MLTVAILINKDLIVLKTAVNQKRSNKKGQTAYKTDKGTIIWHDPSEGAVVLAKRLLGEPLEERDDR